MTEFLIKKINELLDKYWDTEDERDYEEFDKIRVLSNEKYR